MQVTSNKIKYLYGKLKAFLTEVEENRIQKINKINTASSGACLDDKMMIDDDNLNYYRGGLKTNSIPKTKSNFILYEIKN